MYMNMHVPFFRLLYRETVQEKLLSVGSVREELGKVERVRPGWRKLYFWNDKYLVSCTRPSPLHVHEQSRAQCTTKHRERNRKQHKSSHTHTHDSLNGLEKYIQEPRGLENRLSVHVRKKRGEAKIHVYTQSSLSFSVKKD